MPDLRKGFTAADARALLDKQVHHKDGDPRNNDLGNLELVDAPQDEDPPCECIRIDVDLDDSRYCPLHGPLAKIQRQQEAADEAAFWSGGNNDSIREDGCPF